MTKPGDVFVTDNAMFVVRKMVDGVVTEAQLLETYIAQNTFITFQDGPKTIQELIEHQTDRYLNEIGYYKRLNLQ